MMSELQLSLADSASARGAQQSASRGVRVPLQVPEPPSTCWALPLQSWSSMRRLPPPPLPVLPAWVLAVQPLEPEASARLRSQSRLSSQVQPQ